jgi:hypothetical protein
MPQPGATRSPARQAMLNLTRPEEPGIQTFHTAEPPRTRRTSQSATVVALFMIEHPGAGCPHDALDTGGAPRAQRSGPRAADE